MGGGSDLGGYPMFMNWFEQSVYSEDGVDLTLIRWMLSLTPAERLDVLEDFVGFVAEVRARNPQV